MNRGAWWATVHGVAKESDITQQLNNSNKNEFNYSADSWLVLNVFYWPFSLISKLTNLIRYKTARTNTWPVVVQSPSHVQLFAISWTAAHQPSLSLTISWSLPKFMSIASVMPSRYLILCHRSSSDFNLPQHQDLFQWMSSSHQVANVLELQHQYFQRVFRIDFL